MPAPTITALPTPPQRSDAPDVFVSRADAFLGGLPPFRDEANTLAVYFDAQVAAVEDLVASAGFAGTSTSAIFIGTGPKTLFTQPGLSFMPGVFVSLADSAAPTVNAMVGVVTTYNTTTGAMAVDVKKTSGAGEKSAWTVSLSGPPGSDATVTGPSVTAALGYTPVSKAGDTMTGSLKVGAVARVEMAPGAGSYTGIVNFYRQDGQRLAYILGDQTTLYFAKEVGQSFAFQAPLSVEGHSVFTAGNDGSGSGLDADLLRGMAPNPSGFGSTMVSRDAAGNSGFTSVFVADAIGFNINGGAFTARDASTVGLNLGLYINGAVSAASVTERSDRSLKEDIVDLEPATGRLRPVRYRLKATGEERIGFIAQEVGAVQPLGISEPEDGPLEVRMMGLIAHLAQQLNDAQDRIEALERAQ